MSELMSLERDGGAAGWGGGERATSPESGCLESLRGFTKGSSPLPHQPTSTHTHTHTFLTAGAFTNRKYNKNTILAGDLWKIAKCDSVFLTTLLFMSAKLTLWTFTISDKTHVCRGDGWDNPAITHSKEVGLTKDTRACDPNETHCFASPQSL